MEAPGLNGLYQRKIQIPTVHMKHISAIKSSCMAVSITLLKLISSK